MIDGKFAPEKICSLLMLIVSSQVLIIINIDQYFTEKHKQWHLLILSNDLRYLSCQNEARSIIDMMRDFRLHSRTSIKTHERSVGLPYHLKVKQLKKLGLFLISFFFLLILLQITWNLFDQTRNRVIIEANQEKSIIQINNREITEMLSSTEGSFPIPMVKESNHDCQQRKNMVLVETLKNIQIFKEIRQKSQVQLINSENIFNNGDLTNQSINPHSIFDNRDQKSSIIRGYFTKVAPIFPVLYPKFTSPKLLPKPSYFSFDYWNPFGSRNDKKNYENIDDIFLKSNSRLWISRGKYLTVHSDHSIRPIYFVLEVPGNSNKEQKNTKKVLIFGVSILDTTIAIKNTFQGTFIKKAVLRPGFNSIECDEPACNEDYSMIMFEIDPIEILRLQVYEKKSKSNF